MSGSDSKGAMEGAVPYSGADVEMSVLDDTGDVEIPVIAYTEEVPVLREEYATIDKYELVHFVPASLWREIERRTGGAEKDTFIRILCREGVSLEELDTIQGEIEKNLAGAYTTESENRIREYETNVGHRYILT